MPAKTAIITGACSGMGLALTHHLLSSQTTRWRVVLADINEESYSKLSSTLDPARTIFQRTDVSSWEDNALLFKMAFEWQSSEDGQSPGRIDFFAANAGISDQEMVTAKFDLEAEPTKPNLKTIDVNMLAVFYGLKLFIHYSRKTWAHLPPSAPFAPAMTITASAVGLYSFPVSPQYCAAKYGLVGLTRSVGAQLLAEDSLSVNAILPGLVSTGLTPSWMISQCPQAYLTPMSTILRAHDELMQEENVDGRMQRKSGKCLEVSQGDLHYREPVEFPSEGQRWLFDNDADKGFLMAVKRYGRMQKP